MPCFSPALFPPARFAAAAFAVGTLLFLGGCQGGNPPSAPGTTTATPTATAPESGIPSLTITTPSGVYKPADSKGKAQNVPVPVMPALAKENTKEGLEAFIRYWYAQLSYVDETGEMSGWLPLFTEDCRLCVALQKSGEDGYVKGRWLEGGRISVPAVEVQWKAMPGSVATKVQVVQEAIQYHNADGTTGRAASEASNDAFALFANFTNDAWKVVDLGVIA